MFPTGNLVDDLVVPGVGTLKATMINAGIPTVFVNADAIGYKGTELQDAINGDAKALAMFESIRAHGAIRMGLIKSVDGIRMKKKFFWDQCKIINRHWLAANMNGEAFFGFTAFNNKKMTGADTIDFIKYRRMLADGDYLVGVEPANTKVVNRAALRREGRLQESGDAIALASRAAGHRGVDGHLPGGQAADRRSP